MNIITAALAIASLFIPAFESSYVFNSPLISLQKSSTPEEERSVVYYKEYQRNASAPYRIFNESLGADVTAISAIVQDIDSDTVLWEKNPDQIRAIASITKLASLMVILDIGIEIEEIATITSEDYTTLGYRTFNVGDTVSVKDLLASVIISSDNTAMRALARISGLPRDDFIKKMNSKAQNIGLDNTKFVDVTGLSGNNVSTAREVLYLSRAAFSYHFIRQYSVMPKMTIEKNGEFKTDIYSTNKLLGGMVDINAGKTGFVTESGYNFVAESTRDDNKLLGVVLGSATDTDRFQDYKMMTHWTWEHYTWPE